MSWHFSQALVAAYSEANSSDGEPCAPLKSTLTLELYFKPGKTTVALSLFQSGTTLKLLTDYHGEAVLTWFQAGFRAKAYQAAETKADLNTLIQDSGPTKPASFAKWDRDSFLWRTPQTSFLEDLDQFSGTWPRWGSMQLGVAYPLPHVERLKPGKESGLLPTHTAGDGKGARNGTCPGRDESWGITLTDWLWLNVGRNSRLHPESGEWIMDWPTGWTDCAAPATDKFQQWLNSHGRP